MRSKLLALGPAVLILVGCDIPHVEPIVQHVYCLTPDQYKALVDAEPPKIGNNLDKDARVSNKQLTQQNILVRRYADGLLKVLGGCIGQPQQPAS